MTYFILLTVLQTIKKGILGRQNMVYIVVFLERKKLNAYYVFLLKILQFLKWRKHFPSRCDKNYSFVSTVTVITYKILLYCNIEVSKATLFPTGFSFSLGHYHYFLDQWIFFRHGVKKKKTFTALGHFSRVWNIRKTWNLDHNFISSILYSLSYSQDVNISMFEFLSRKTT